MSYGDLEPRMRTNDRKSRRDLSVGGGGANLVEGGGLTNGTAVRVRVCRRRTRGRACWNCPFGSSLAAGTVMTDMDSERRDGAVCPLRMAGGKFDGGRGIGIIVD